MTQCHDAPHTRCLFVESTRLETLKHLLTLGQQPSNRVFHSSRGKDRTCRDVAPGSELACLMFCLQMDQYFPREGRQVERIRFLDCSLFDGIIGWVSVSLSFCIFLVVIPLVVYTDTRSPKAFFVSMAEDHDEKTASVTATAHPMAEMSEHSTNEIKLMTKDGSRTWTWPVRELGGNIHNHELRFRNANTARLCTGHWWASSCFFQLDHCGRAFSCRLVCSCRDRYSLSNGWRHLLLELQTRRYQMGALLVLANSLVELGRLDCCRTRMPARSYQFLHCGLADPVPKCKHSLREVVPVCMHDRWIAGRCCTQYP